MKKIALKMIFISSIAYILGFALCIWSMAYYNNGIVDEPSKDLRFIILYIVTLITIACLIYSIILWGKYDKNPFVILGLIFLNVFYMPWFYFRIKKMIH